MNSEYVMQKGWKIAAYTTAVLMVTGSIYLIRQAVIETGHTWMSILGAVLILLAAGIALDTQKSKLIISEYSIILQEIFTDRKLSITNVKGYRIKQNTLIIYPVDKTERLIYLKGYSYLENYDELLTWVKLNFNDLDAADYQAQINDILQDDSFGRTQRDKLSELKKTKKLCSYLTYAGTFIFIWLIAYPHPYRYAIISGALFPLLVIGVFCSKRQIITFNSSEDPGGSAYPSLSTALLMTVTGLFLRDLQDLDLLNVIDIAKSAILTSSL